MKQKSLIPLLLVVSVSAAGAATILNPTSLGRVSFKGNKSTTSDFLSSTSGSSGMPVGDSTDGTTVHAGLFNFTVTSYVTEVATASQILFQITPTATGGLGANIRLVALTTDVNSISGSASTAAGTIVATIPYSSVSINSPLVFDVTSYVKADALAGNFTSFRLESTLEAAVGSTADIVTFATVGSSDAQLQIIPEPGSTSLVVAAGALGLLRKRRQA